MHRFLSLCVLFLTAASAWAQPTSKVQLDSSETIFSLMAALNACGYDQELNTSPSLRAQVRSEVAAKIASSNTAASAANAICGFYRDHRFVEPGRDLSQYISLALNLSLPPFTLKVKEADLPPDATYVLGVVPLLQRFYEAAELHSIWINHERDYDALIQASHKSVTDMLLSTDVYLKMPISGYAGRSYVIYLEALVAPGQVNARNYGDDYLMVVSPENGTLPMSEIRHTYLHFILDPLSHKRAHTFKRLEPLLAVVASAPMEDVYKRDTSLLVNESLIRAIEARLIPGKGENVEKARAKAVQQAASEGFILAPYFYEQLVEFERTPESLRDSYGDMLYGLNIGREKKRSSGIVWTAKTTPEWMHTSESKPPRLLELANAKLSAGDTKGAGELAQQALGQNKEDLGLALFILAKVAARNQDMTGARDYFERTLKESHDPHVLTWSHIYLGRICDLKEERELAVEHYRAALKNVNAAPDARRAAQRGLEQPYEPQKPQAGGDNQESREDQN